MKTSVLGPQRVLLFCVAIALILAQLAPASAQTNEGTLSGTLAAFGTVNATGSGWWSVLRSPCNSAAAWSTIPTSALRAAR
jgi:hypothetical protein